MSNKEHTPWKYEYDNDTGSSDESFREFHTIVDANGDSVGECHSEEKAALIVRAVNNHESLVKALEDSKEALLTLLMWKFRDSGDSHIKASEDAKISPDVLAIEETLLKAQQ